jgi:protein-tyrosine phosphatase
MQAEILQILQSPDSTEQIARAVDALNNGKLIVLPTETVYGVCGLLANADARSALQSIRQGAKKPFTIHLANPEQALPLLGEVNEFAHRVIRKLWPGPVGLQFDIPKAQQEKVSSELGVGPEELFEGSALTLRCPDHPIFYIVAAAVNQPLAVVAPAGRPARLEDVDLEIMEKVEMAFDAGPTRYSKPSTLAKVNENNCQVIRAGVYDQRIIDRLLQTTILFVCSGNTCRSPMAQAIATKSLADRFGLSPDRLEEKGISVISAGSFAMPGARATPEAIEAVRSIGVDLSRHRSQPLSVELIHRADFIYTMSRSHAKTVTALVPSAAEKTQPLDPDSDVADPIGSDISVYNEVASQLKTLIEKRFSEVKIA